MKRGILTALVVVIACWASRGQSCLPEGIVFSTQSQLDNFAINYPGCIEIEGNVAIFGNSIINLNGLSSISSIGGYLTISGPSITSLAGLENLTDIGGNFLIGSVDVAVGGTSLVDLAGLSSLNSVNGDIFILNNNELENLNGLNNFTAFQGSINIKDNEQLSSLEGLSNLTLLGGSLTIHNNDALTNLQGLENLSSTGGRIFIRDNDALADFSGLQNISYIGGDLDIYKNAITSLSALGNLNAIGGNFFLEDNSALASLAGLEQLSAISGYLLIRNNTHLSNLLPLSALYEIGTFLLIENNPALTSLEGLNHAVVEDLVWIKGNPLLSDCAVFTVCHQLLTQADNVIIENNAPSCNTIAEVEFACNGVPVLVKVLMDANGDCVADLLNDGPAFGIQVRLNSNTQMATRPTQVGSDALFGYLDAGTFSLSLTQFPTNYWGVCQDTFWIDPADFQDTIFATFLLQPLTSCPDLSVEIGLPPAFRGCLVETDMQVEVRNAGTVPAENTAIAVVLPLAILDVISSSLPVTFQNGDTLFFQAGALMPFEAANLNLTLRTQCDTFLQGQTLCIEAFANAENECPVTPETFSEIWLYSECIDDETVRFTIKNIGNAPTQGLHEYVIIEDEVILFSEEFDLDPQETTIINVPANGATYRMEATRFDNGVQTAIALENCGGLTPGLITAHWIDPGLNNYDYDCRQVILAYDPNQKTVIPKGIGESHLTAANRPFQYTIEFQNTGTDTAFRVLLTDILSPHLDVNTFRPGFSSHPYSWEIRGLDTLNVLFFPIALPDSNVNVAGSQGFFTFDIDQRPDLPDGTVIENTASIVFDFNPPIVTNTTFHTIGELVVNIDEPERGAKPKWKVFANPVKAAATFQAIGIIAGEKRFELFDAAGRKVRNERFDGQEFLFQRQTLLGGLYFFKITDEKGRTASGKIIVAN
ncbi:MAG: T9SS type A sorting domain-containing protein [Saprospiraceae bacterium]